MKRTNTTGTCITVPVLLFSLFFSGATAHSRVDSDSDSITITIPGHRAEHIHSVEPVPAASPLKLPTTVTARWNDVIWSDRLADVARTYAQATLDHDGSELPPTFLQFLLAWSGCPESTAAVITLSTSEDSTTDLLLHLDQIVNTRQRTPTHVGAARVRFNEPPFRWRWVAVASRRSIVFAEPLPSTIDPDQPFTIRFRLLHELEQPHVVLLDPRTELHEVPVVSLDSGWYEAHCDTSEGIGRWRLQIMTEGPSGPAVVTQVPLLVGIEEEQPAQWSGLSIGTRSTSAGFHEAEERMLMLLNDDRAQLGLPALRHDPRLAAVARAHSRDMDEHSFFAHESPTAGGLGERLSVAGYLSRRSRENIAQASTVRSAQIALWESPSHRANILAVDVSHIGIGIVIDDDDGTLVATQVFAEPIVHPSKSQVATAVEDRVMRARTQGKLPRMGRDERLDQAAQRLAEDAAKHGRLNQAALTAELVDLAASGMSVSQMNAELRTFGSLEVLDELNLATDVRPRRAGFGVAQHDSPQGPIFTVVVISVGGSR